MTFFFNYIYFHVVFTVPTSAPTHLLLTAPVRQALEIKWTV